MSFHDRALLGGTALSRPRIRAYTRDAMMTFDRATIDSTGAFLVAELERLDPTLNKPLVAYTWSRDIDLREDVGVGDEYASFTNSSFASLGGIRPGGVSWVGKDANAIQGIALDIGKTPQPLHLWAQEASWTLPELASAQQLGRAIDADKLEALNLKHQMDIDQVVYTGDVDLGFAGLMNSTAVTATNVATVSGATTWAAKVALGSDTGAAAILADVNTVLNATWQASGWSVVPSDLRLPPAQYSLIVQAKVSTAGNMSILEYLKANSLSNAINGRPLNIQPVKWLTGAGVGAADRMMAYTKDPKYVRYPLVPLQHTVVENRSLHQLTTYYGRLGQVEFRYPETISYCDGL